MRRKALKTLFFIIGLLAIGAAIVVIRMDAGFYESNYSYGGDAYTGIQNAAAQSANNVMSVGIMIRTAFSALLATCGLVILALAICIKPNDPPVYVAVQQTNTVETNQEDDALQS
ncbi:MAG: hypothetical protein IJA74_03325 [Oscillospiraceae bacterium]|nr:hypothetical protein [Oscillospiraceae bacterium]